MNYYAGIGSRQSPNDILKLMSEIASKLANEQWILRSGGAKGADKAFESWAGELKEIYRPKHTTPEAMKLAMEHHPAPQHCNDYVRKLHGRNAIIVLGLDLITPVKFVACWTYKGNLQGGTALGMRIAEANNIPVFNLAFDDKRDLFEQYISGKKSIDEIISAA